MATQNLVPLRGLSGSQYTHEVCDYAGNWVTKPGNYAFAGVASEGIAAFWRIFYVGKADNLRARISGHDRWAEAVALGATHVLAHVNENGDEDVLAEECDLIRAYDPPLNKQHRMMGLADVFARAR